MAIETYADRHRLEWDDFVERSKNGTFLFLRDYMDYHRDRFDDCSLIVRGADGRIVALLPGNRRGNALVSHGGLTYGGFVTDERMKTPVLLRSFCEVADYLREGGLTTLEYKTVPHIYHRLPAEEDRYVLFLANATVKRRGLLAVAPAGPRPSPQPRRVRGARKAQASAVLIAESRDFGAFWPVLTERLQEAHGVQPVHTLPEIESLHQRFPGQIRLFVARTPDAATVAGIVVYETPRVAHCQYVASSAAGRELHALDLLFSDVLSGEYAAKPYFDFGTSDEDDGWTLNEGLVEQKEGFGARAIVHDHYTIDLGSCDLSRIRKALT